MTTEKEISIWAQAVYSLLDGKTAKEGRILTERLEEILKKRKKAYLLPGIIKKFKVICLKKQRAELFLAMGHSAATIGKIKEKLFKIILPAGRQGGKEKSVDVKIEKELIGGFRAKTSNLLVKASIKDFLDELKYAVNHT